MPKIDGISRGVRSKFWSVLIYIHTLHMRAAEALASRCIFAGSSEPVLLKNAISTKISCSGSYVLVVK